MKLERLHEYVTSVTVIGLGLLFAVFCAQLTGSGQLKILGLMGVAVFCTALAVGLRTKIWLLIPLFWELTGRIPLLEVPVTVRDMAVALVFGSYLVFHAVKIVRVKPQKDLIDVLVLLNLFYLVTVYIRNPVGVQALGSEMVGGRPYFNVFVAFLAYLVIARVPIDLRTTRSLPVMLVIGSLLISLGSLMVNYFPSTVGVLSKMYSAFAPQETYSGVAAMTDEVGRQTGLGSFGANGMRFLTSYFPPLTLFTPLYLGRFVTMLLSMAAVLLSGFRSVLFTVALFVLMAAYFRRRINELAILSIVGLGLYGMLALGHGRLFHLPVAAQRAMSFLPGNWDHIAVSDAAGSSEWRFEMWEIVMKEDKWIRNKWLGDGFGFTRVELAIMEDEMRGGAGFVGGAVQEGAMIVGAYHNGPLSTIRYVGLVGLALFFPTMIALAWRSYRLIVNTANTPLFAVALFVGMPAILSPLIFAFMVGGFDSNFPELIFSAAMLKLLTRAQSAWRDDHPPVAAPEETRPIDRPSAPFLQPPAGLQA